MNDIQFDLSKVTVELYLNFCEAVEAKNQTGMVKAAIPMMEAASGQSIRDMPLEHFGEVIQRFVDTVNREKQSPDGLLNWMK